MTADGGGAGGGATEAAIHPESGQMMVFLIGLVVLILMVLGLGWDASNWFLGHRALNNLADGAAIAAASEVDLRVFYASGGRRVELAEGQAAATVRRYLDDVAADSGIEGVSLAAVRVAQRPARGRGLASSSGPQVTVELRAVAPVAFLRFLHFVAPEIEGRATATAEVVG
jgi:uncharacterized membrane protein